MRYVAIAAAAARVLAAGAARAESEPPHPGFISPTYHGGPVAELSGEDGSGFDLSRARPHRGGGHVAASGEDGGAFDAAAAVRIGVPPDSETAFARRMDETVRRAAGRGRASSHAPGSTPGAADRRQVGPPSLRSPS